MRSRTHLQLPLSLWVGLGISVVFVVAFFFAVSFVACGGRVPGSEEFQRDVPAQLFIPRPVHRRRRAATKAPAEPVNEPSDTTSTAFCEPGKIHDRCGVPPKRGQGSAQGARTDAALIIRPALTPDPDAGNIRPRCPCRGGPAGYRSPAWVMRSATLVLLSLAGSMAGAWSWSRGVSLGLAGTSLPTVYSKESPVCRTC